jgi:hypothetical protein
MNEESAAFNDFDRGCARQAKPREDASWIDAVPTIGIGPDILRRRGKKKDWGPSPTKSAAKRR